MNLISRLYLSFAGLLLLSSGAFAQSAGESGLAEIKEISLRDTFLIQSIATVIDTTFVPEKNVAYDHERSPYEQGKGYVRLDIYNHRLDNLRTRYVLTAALETIEEDYPDSSYPQAFSYIDGRLVLVYCGTCIDELLATTTPLSESTKSALRERLEPFLVPTVKAMLPGKDGELEEANFRIHTYLRMNGDFEILVDVQGNHTVNTKVSHYL